MPSDIFGHVERPDHFANMRREPLAAEPPEGAPVVTPALIEWLEREFAVPPPRDWNGLDDVVNLLGATAMAYGEQRVIAHLKLLMKVA
jgi:hypothetical protein